MKHRIMMLVLALVLVFALGVTAFADKTETNGNVTTITDENGNTITVEEVDENEDGGTVNFATPTPQPTAAPTAQPTAAPANTPANGNGSQEQPDAPEQAGQTPAETAAPADGKQPEQTPDTPEGPDADEPTDAPSDKLVSSDTADPDASDAPEKAKTAKHNSTLVYVLMVILTVIFIAGAWRLYQLRKKK